jgi:hypothetical protein
MDSYEEALWPVTAFGRKVSHGKEVVQPMNSSFSGAALKRA